MVITFEVQARCEALELSEDDREVQYVFSGCGELQSASSNTINLNYAVLNVEVEPAISSGIIGTTIQRTIRVVNSGNGATTGFVLPATYGAVLSTRGPGWTDRW